MLRITSFCIATFRLGLSSRNHFSELGLLGAGQKTPGRGALIGAEADQSLSPTTANQMTRMPAKAYAITTPLTRFAPTKALRGSAAPWTQRRRQRASLYRSLVLHYAPAGEGWRPCATPPR